MRPSRSVSLAVAALAPVGLAAVGLATLVGCQPPPKPPAPQPAMAPVPSASQVQNQMMTVDPRAKVGRVDDVIASSHRAAVGGIAPTDVKVGDTISFLGGDHSTLANGTVESIVDGRFLIVDYSTANGGRDPADGDLAVTVPLGR